MAMSHLFGCMDCPPCPEPFWDMEKPDMEKNGPQNGPWNFWKPLTADYVAAGAFFSQENGPIFLEAPNLWVRCRRRFFFQKNGPHISASPQLVGTLLQALFFSRKMAPHILGGFLRELFAIAESETLKLILSSIRPTWTHIRLCFTIFCSS